MKVSAQKVLVGEHGVERFECIDPGHKLRYVSGNKMKKFIHYSKRTFSLKIDT